MVYLTEREEASTLECSEERRPTRWEMRFSEVLLEEKPLTGFRQGDVLCFKTSVLDAA